MGHNAYSFLLSDSTGLPISAGRVARVVAMCTFCDNRIEPNDGLEPDYQEGVVIQLAKDPALWERVRTSDVYARHRADIRREYDACCRTPSRPRTAREILGNQDHPRYINNLRRIQASALMALIYPDDAGYYDSLVDTVWTFCEEYSWAPLGHYNSYYDRTPADYDTGLIDIFAASIGFSMAEIKVLFADRFPTLLKDRMSAEIKRRIIDPYLSRRYFWEKHDNNWSAVCASAVGGVLMYEAPEVYQEQMSRIDSTLEGYLASYADDGICVEGVAYWGFGFGFFVAYALLQKDFTHGEKDWFANRKVEAIATYLQRMFLQREVLATFGDCNVREGYWVGLPHILRSVYPDSVEKLPTEKSTVITYAHLCFSLRSVVFYKPEYVGGALENTVWHAPKSGFFLKRTDRYGFAAKGGNNGESHNHNDVGSFILARDNRQILCDLGYIGPTACPGYHETERYTYFNPSSFSHNVPYFNGIPQDGIRRADAYAEYDEQTETVSLDFTGGYGVPELKKAVRAFTFSEAMITLRDTFVATSPMVVTERFVAVIEPRVEGIEVIVGDVRLVPKTDVTLNLVRQPYCAQLPDANGSHQQTAYCIDYTLKAGQTVFDLEMLIGVP